ncbi:NFAT activating protein with ITAM motif 1 [Phyllostomus discolor]|uniref:NFAT activating protein with ITAM motif 1 n=1 Tax=Phyllostomus discolor TaxID=89673 RepID=A0A7E6D8K8_9CHIR|nr:NFAT activation molecule 1 [Phyllostomus discolor]KAF6120620.1 NFAT activating protein with ITAM motif 1 [Phyllostomus discolor]
MESRPRRPWAPPGPLTAPWLLGLLLCPWTPRPTGGQSVTHTGPPIMVTLANKSVSFNCRITYPYTPQFKNFTVRYYYVDRQGHQHLHQKTGCLPAKGKENQTLTQQCSISPKLRDASATGTYYCSVLWQKLTGKGNGTFILVRDTGYREPSRDPRNVLLFCLIGLLSVLSILCTALLLWKKKQMKRSHKRPARKGRSPALAPGPAASTATAEQPPAAAESLYTALQRRETEIYACMQPGASRTPSSGSLVSQENPHRFENDDEFNLVYENL